MREGRVEKGRELLLWAFAARQLEERRRSAEERKAQLKMQRRVRVAAARNGAGGEGAGEREGRVVASTPFFWAPPPPRVRHPPVVPAATFCFSFRQLLSFYLHAVPPHIPAPNANDGPPPHPKRTSARARVHTHSYHGCILAYGQTGSGKTHSLLGASSDAAGAGSGPAAAPGAGGNGGGPTAAAEDAGLLVRLITDLFVQIAADARHVYTGERKERGKRKE